MDTATKQQIKEQLNVMLRYMEADSYLCGCADMPYDYWRHLNENFRIIANRIGVSVKEVETVYDEM